MKRILVLLMILFIITFLHSQNVIQYEISVTSGVPGRNLIMWEEGRRDRMIFRYKTSTVNRINASTIAYDIIRSDGNRIVYLYNGIDEYRLGSLWYYKFSPDAKYVLLVTPSISEKQSSKMLTINSIPDLKEIYKYSANDIVHKKGLSEIAEFEISAFYVNNYYLVFFNHFGELGKLSFTARVHLDDGHIEYTDELETAMKYYTGKL